MPISLRPVRPDDYPRVAELLNLEQPEPITANTIREWEATSVALHRPQYRLLAIADSGDALGYGHAVRDPWSPPGLFWLHVSVDPAQRSRGVGTLLYHAVRDHAVTAHGATLFRGEVRDHLDGALRFAQRCGFQVERHIFESTLDLAAFDERPFAGHAEAVASQGIRFLTVADAGDTLDARRRLWELNQRTARDVPGFDGAFPPVDAFQKQVCEASWYRPDGQILAADDAGDGDHWIGLSAIGYFANTASAMNTFTGVDRAYRGRGIALALKLLAIHAARRYGAAYIRTNNDSENAPMLAVNRKLGYRPKPGYYRLIQ